MTEKILIGIVVDGIASGRIPFDTDDDLLAIKRFLEWLLVVSHNCTEIPPLGPKCVPTVRAHTSNSFMD